MKDIRELRLPYQFKVDNVTTHLQYLKESVIDYDVYLPTIGKNLQRPLCWNIDQKRELVMSVLLGRKLPKFSLIIKDDDSYEVIDGKQRLTTLFSFLGNEFSVTLEGGIYYFKDLPKDYQLQFNRLQLEYDRMIEFSKTPIPDKTKIDWFYYINFAGTLQDVKHMESLKTAL